VDGRVGDVQTVGRTEEAGGVPRVYTLHIHREVYTHQVPLLHIHREAYTHHVHQGGIYPPYTQGGINQGIPFPTRVYTGYTFPNPVYTGLTSHNLGLNRV